MTALELIAQLREAGIRLRAVDGELEIDAPRGALTADLKDELVRNKPHLLRLLSWSRRADKSADIRLEPVSRDVPLELSWAQQRLWFLDQLEPNSSAYNISWTVRLRGALRFADLQAALNRLTDRHEALRTVFPADDGVPVQHILESQAVTIARHDLRSTSEERMRTQLANLAARSFDLEAGPLLRADLLQTGADEHILLIVIHHIVADGASMRILFRELASLYDEAGSGVPASLPELPVQYADYAAWQRKWLDGAELERQAGYWVNKLAGLPPLLELPTDRPRSAAMRFRGASVLHVLPAELAAELRALGRAQGCTLFMVMLTAFFVLLQRYSGRDDLVVGTPMGGRPRTGLEGLIGFFINTVVLRQDLGNDPAFSELLTAVRETALEAHAHQELPFERLVEMLAPERELSYSPVFQVMFDLQEEPRWQLPVNDLEVVPEVVFSSRTSSFDLTLSVRQAESGLDAMFEYDTDLFDEESIEKLALHYRNLLEALVANPELPISRYALLGADEQRSLLDSWASQPPAADAFDLVSAFTAAAGRYPDNNAVVHEGQAWSYAELNRRANRLAHRLQVAGLQHEDAVLLLAERTPNYFAAVLAVLKAGGCVVPLDPQYPEARLRVMSEVAAAKFALVADSAPNWLAQAVTTTVELNEQVFTDASYPADDPAALLSGDSLAFILFTSGTTGKPKGVELQHAGLANYIHALGLRTEISATDHVLQFASLSFDIALEETFAAWLHGAALVLRTNQAADSMHDFTGFCADNKISWLSLPTAWWHEWCFSLQSGDLHIPQQLRCVVIGGERARRDALQAWLNEAADVQLLNTYGPTETSIVATWCELNQIDPDAAGDLPIGAPVPGVSAWVLDEGLNLAPPGVPGQLCIGGVGLARAYRGNKQTTDSRFIVREELGGRLYCTGDRARYRRDGQLEFLGRTDTQIKIRGHRIEAADIEVAANAVTGVEQCVVVASADTESAFANTTQLLAYYTGAIHRDELGSALRDVLPDYMVPAVFVQLEKLPLTVNGKIDIKSLPVVEPAAVRSAAATVAPRTATEEQLAAIWAEVLQLDSIGVHDDFFALGGHSLLATRVIARVRDRLQLAVSLRQLFRAPTVACLAAELEQGGGAAHSHAIGVRTDPEELPPLSSAQQRLWFIDQLEPGNTAFNLPWVARLSGAVDAPTLQTALAILVERHASLRTNFALSHGVPVQIIAQRTAVKLEQFDCTSAEIDMSQTLQRVDDWVDQPFSLSSDALLRVALFKLADDDYVLALVMHHIVSDGWSVGVLLRELGQCYSSLLNGRHTELPELPVQYADYAYWQQQQLSDDVWQEQVEFWRHQLRDLPPLFELPCDRPRPAAQSYRGAWVSTELSVDLLARLQRLAAGEGCTLFMLLLAGFKFWLARCTGRNDVVVGTPVAGRQSTELEGLLGFFLNTLPLRTRVDIGASFIELMRRVRHTTVDAFENQDLPFEAMLEILQPARSTAFPPVAQVYFNFVNTQAGTLELPDITVEPLFTERSSAKFDLSAVVVEQGDGLRIGFEYNTDIFAATTVAGWLQAYTELLESVVANPDATLQHVATPVAITEPRPEQAFEEFDERACAGTITQRFAEIAQRYAGEPAVDDGVNRWSYQVLQRVSRRVAVDLQAFGASGPVAVCLPQSAEAVAALLGVLEAGLPYVPLDIDAPDERLRELATLVDATTVVTDQANAERLGAVFAANLQILTVQPAAQVEALTPLAESAARPDDLAYVLFTSGTSGTPKGVMQSHANVLRHTRAYTNALHLSQHDRLSQLAHYGFDAAVMDIFGALLNGACLCPVDLRRGANVNAIAEQLFGDQGVTLLHATPTVFRYLMTAECLPSAAVRMLVLGGEEALASDFELFRQHFHRPALFVNGLGPSESTLALQFFANHKTELPHGVVPVGRAVAGTEISLDGDVNSGELLICSAQVATGYWRQPELSAKCFAEQGDKRRYRSGDLLQCLPDGSYVYRGRVDQQIKLRGHRIEPGEIESRLLGCAQVERCCVLLHASEQSGEQLIAYYHGDATAQELRRLLLQQLPAYMVPALFVAVADWPLLSNGKTDRHRLPAPDFSGAERKLLPTSPTEDRLAEIWRDALGVNSVSVNETFFELGGHSLLATGVVARIHDSFGKQVSLRDFFAAPTIGELAELLDHAECSATERPPAPRERGELVPLSWSQQRLWFLDQLEPDSVAYNLHWAAQLTGPLDRGALQSAVTQVIARHESLRTRFATQAGEPVQIVETQALAKVEFEDLRGASAGRLEQHILKCIRQPFELSAGGLARVQVLETGKDQAVVLITAHHIVTDGWSMGVLFNDISAFYNAAVTGQVADLDPLPLQYADFTLWQRERLSGAELARQEQYWQQQLAGLPPLLELAADKPRPPVQRYRGAWASEMVAPRVLQALRKLASDNDCSLYMVLLAAFYVLLARQTGREDLVVGSPVAGRTRTEFNNLIGFFLNTLVLRADLSGNPSFSDLLQQVQRMTLAAYDHQDLPFEKLLELVQPVRSTAYAPLVQVTFNLHNEPAQRLAPQGLTVEPFSVDRGTAKFDLAVALAETSEGLHAGFEYNTDLFEPETVAEMLTQYRNLLSSIVANPTAAIADLAMVTAERNARGGAAPAVQPLPTSIAKHFLRTAEEFADRPAVHTGDTTTTYSELRAATLGVSELLREALPQPGRRVALLLGHDSTMLAGVMGTLCAGHAYVPVDPHAPEQRQRTILEAAAVDLILAAEEYVQQAELLASAALPVIKIDQDVGAQQSEYCADTPADSLAYILFTSGSTGTPKGVMQTQRNLLHHALTYAESTAMQATDRVSLLAGYGFDAAVMDIFAALLTGACLYPLEIRKEEYPGQLLDQMGFREAGGATAGVTLLHSTPTVFRYLMRHKVCRHDMSVVRAVVLGGEEALPGDFALFKKHFAPPAQFVNGLGPSESTTALQFFADHRTRLPGQVVPIGRPVRDTDVVLLDSAGKPGGISGEIAIRSPYVSVGYLDRPELTAQKFLSDESLPGAVLYKTGDRARRLPDGTLVYIGRTDAQIKIRGHRVEPGEIEATLVGLEGVERCAVALRDGPAAGVDDMRLVAWIVGNVSDVDARRYLKSRLPEYMVPAAFILLVELPLTANGKIDRQALPDPEWQRIRAEDFVAPRTPTEHQLAGIWSDVLGIKEVGVHDDFFELGGHSLLAAQLVARVTETLQVGLPLRKLFDAPTIADIAEHVETLQWALRSE